MNFSGLILSAVLVLLLSVTAQCRKTNCKSECCTFVEGFPARLKELRSSYKEILKFYESNDDLDALIDGTVQHNINGPYGCHVVDEILRFYLNTVLPTAVKKNRAHTKTPIDSIGNIFQSLQRDMLKCRKHFFCYKPFEITSFKDSYEKMAGRGVNKAMEELDLLFMYIEQFLASKRDMH